MTMSVHIDGSRIREARLSAGLTQAQLARAIETPERNIIRWENNQNEPRVTHIVAIAHATGRDLDFFLTGSAEADEDEEAALSLDEYLRVRIRQILHEEMEAPR
jgi:transcriptional regulator with XRE-family HTH domain